MGANHTVEIRITASNLSDPAFKALIADLKQVGTAADAASAHVSASGTAAGSAGGGFRTMASEVGNIATGVFAATQVLGGFLGTAGRVASSVLGMNSSMEQTTVAFTQLLGSASAANSMMDQLRAFNKESPFDLPQIAQAARQMLAYGDAAQDVVPHLRAIGDAVASLGGGTAEVQLAVRALGQMSAAGRITAQDMDQLAQLGINGYKILGEQLGMTTAQVKALGEQGKLLSADTLPLLYAGLEQNFGGGMAAQATTFNGILSNVRDTFGQIVMRISQPMFAQLKSDLNDLYAYTQTDAFGARVQDWADKAQLLSDRAQAFATTNGPAMVAMLGDIATEAGKGAVTLGQFIEALQKADAAHPAARKADVGDLTTYPSAVDAFLNQTQTGLGQLSVAIHKSIVDAFTPGDFAGSSGAWGEFFRFMHDGLTDEERDAKKTAEAQKFLENSMTAGHQAAMDYAEGNRDLAASQYVVNEAYAKFHPIAEEHAKALLDINVGYEAVARTQRENAKEASDAAIGQAQFNALAAETATGSAAAVSALVAQRAALEGLAGAYQIGLGIQQTYNAQASEYAGQANTITKALDIIHQKQSDGIALSKDEQRILDLSTDALARYAGGQQDATETAATYAINNAILMKSQDEISRQYPTLIAGSAEYNQKLKDIFIAAGGSAEAFDTMQRNGGGLQAAISGPGGLTQTILDLIAALRDAGAEHPKPTVDIIVNGLKDLEGVHAQLEALDGKSYNATVNIGVQGVGFAGPNGEFVPSGPDAPTLPGPPDLTPPPADGRGPQRYAQGYGPTDATPTVPSDQLRAAQDAAQNAASYVDFIKAMVQSLADAAAEMGDGMDNAKKYADLAKTTLDVLSEAAQFLTDTGDKVFLYGDFQAKNIQALKQVTEKAVDSLGDSAALWDGDGLDHLQKYADAGKASLEVMTSAVDLVKAMGDQTILYGDWQASNIANLKFIAEKATVSIGESAAVMDGPFLDGIGKYADAAQAALATESAALDFLDKLGDGTALAGRTVQQVGIAAQTLATDSRIVAEAFGTVAADWDAARNQQLSDLNDAVSASTGALGDTLSLMQTVSKDTDGLHVSVQRVVIGAQTLSTDARIVAEAYRAVAADWTDDANQAMSDLNDGVGSATGALGSTLSLMQSFADDTDHAHLTTQQIVAGAQILSTDARLVAEAYRAVATDWGDGANDAMAHLDDAVGSATGALSPTLQLMQAFAGDQDTLHLSQERITAQAQILSTDARLIAEAYKQVAADYDGAVNPALADLNDAVQSSTGALSSTLDFLSKLDDYESPSPEKLAKIGRELAQDAVLFVGYIRDAEQSINGDAVTAAGQWATGAGQVVSLMGQTADAMDKIAKVSEISKKQAGIFTANFQVVLDLVRELNQMAQPYKADAEAFRKTAEDIAAAMNAAASAIQTIQPPQAPAGGGGGGTGGNGVAGFDFGLGGKAAAGTNADQTYGVTGTGGGQLIANVYLDSQPVAVRVQGNIARMLPTSVVRSA